MADQPERAAGVPETGIWNPTLEKWEVCTLDPQGVRVGECLRYRPDGTLFSRSRYVAGLQEGAFEVFHRDGQLAREGTFVADMFDGPIDHYASTAPNGEPLRVCCVPPNAVRMSVHYQAGEFLQELFYDGAGRAIQSDGTPWPARPATVPDQAAYHEESQGWKLRTGRSERIFSPDGVLTEEHDFADGVCCATRTFDGGLLAESREIDRDRRRHGDYYRRLIDGAAPQFADPRIRSERGVYVHGQPVGVWTFFAGDGSLVTRADRGAAFDEGTLSASPAFAATAGAGDWWVVARALRQEGRTREALVAAARAAADGGAREALLAFRAETVVALAPEVATQWGEHLLQAADATIAGILDGLVCGADPASALRALASALPLLHPAAPALVEASLLLAPDRPTTRMTRALLRFQRGDEAGMMADIEAMEAGAPEAASSLRTYARAVFRPFTFTPAREPLVAEEELEGVVVEVGQSAEAIRQLAGVYATRLRRCRAAVLALATGPSPADWLPPDLAALLPAGDAPLKRERITCDLEPGDEGPADTIEIDEQVTTDGAGVPALLTVAHADYAALSWLCWASGLDEVALPGAIVPRPELPLAMGMAVKRCWRARDRLATGGLLARSRGIPGFSWLETEIDALPTHLVEIVAAEYLAVRSMFLWLASPDALSPFQDDLRDA